MLGGAGCTSKLRVPCGLSRRAYCDARPRIRGVTAGLCIAAPLVLPGVRGRDQAQNRTPAITTPSSRVPPKWNRLELHEGFGRPKCARSFILKYGDGITTINVPKREEVSPANQAIFDSLKSKLGFVPNLYAILAHSEHALANYLAFQSGKSSIVERRAKGGSRGQSGEQQRILPRCAHGDQQEHRLHGQQIFEIRNGTASFEPKLDALARLVRSVVVNRGHGADDGPRQRGFGEAM